MPVLSKERSCISSRDEYLRHEMCYKTQLIGSQECLLYFLKNRIYNISDIQDVQQEINKVVLEKEKDYDSGHGLNDTNKTSQLVVFRRWLFAIARFQLLAYLTRLKRNREDPSAGIAVISDLVQIIDLGQFQAPSSDLIKKERVQLIKKLTHILSGRQKQVFNLLIEDFSHQEISEIIGTSKINVQVLKARTIQRIRNFITNNKNEKYHNY